MDLNDGDRDDYRPTVIGRVVKTGLAICIILVYAILMVRIFMSCEAELSETVLLDDEAGALYDSQKSMFVIWQYEPSDGVDQDSGIWVQNVHYLSTASQLQFTVRVNTEHHPYTEGKQAFYYELMLKTPVNEDVADNAEGYEVTFVTKTDAEGKQFLEKVVKKVEKVQDMYFADEQKHQYGYNRVAFRGVKLSKNTEAVLSIYEDAAHKTLKRSVTVCGPDMIKSKMNVDSASVLRVEGKEAKS